MNTFVSLFKELADAIDIAFIVLLDVNGWVLIVNVINPFANVCLVLPFFIPNTVLLEKKRSPIALTVLFFTCTIDDPIGKFKVFPVVVLLELDVFCTVIVLTVKVCPACVTVWFTVSPITKSMGAPPAPSFIPVKFTTTSFLSNFAIPFVYTDTKGSKL